MTDDWTLPDGVVVVPLGVDTRRSFDSVPAMQRWAAREGLALAGETDRKRGERR